MCHSGVARRNLQGEARAAAEAEAAAKSGATAEFATGDTPKLGEPGDLFLFLGMVTTC